MDEKGIDTDEENGSTLPMLSKTFADSYENITYVKVEPDHYDMYEPATVDPVNTNEDYHKNTKLYECLDCEYSSTELYNYRIHIRRHTGEKPFKCQMCDFCTAHPSALKRHLRIHTGEKPYKCHLCEAKFAQSSPLKQHLITHTGEKPFACDLCDHRFTSASARAKHRKTHLNKQTHTQNSNSNSDLAATISTMISETISTEQLASKRPYACTLCDYKATYPTYLKQHMLKHSGEIFECELCYKKFVNAKNLEIHMPKHSKDKILECEQCEFKTVHRISLKQHMLIHNGGKPFACDICSFRTAYAQALKGHLRTHTGEKPYKCDQCDYQTAYPSHLKKHLKRHAGLKPYKCDICEFHCMHPSILKRHILSHTGERPFPCTLCKFSSTHGGGLKEHMKTHTGEKPYACDECGHRCARKSNIKKHIRTHTKVKGVGRKSIKIVNESGPVNSSGQEQSKELCNIDIKLKNSNNSNSEIAPPVTVIKTEEESTDANNLETKMLETKIKIEPLDYTDSTDALSCNDHNMHIDKKSKVLESQEAYKYPNQPVQEHQEEKSLQKTLLLQSVNVKVEEMLRCDFCDYETDFSYSFKEHVKTHA